jgi:hypothetical protein
MKITSLLLAAAVGVASVGAHLTKTITVATETDATTTPIATTTTPTTQTPQPKGVVPAPTAGSLDGTAPTPVTTPEKGNASSKKDAPTATSKLKARPIKGEYHMEPVRVVHARAQSDAPIAVNGRFVSSFGKGDLVNGYTSALDTVNTASVEGALMYVQAEGINIRARSKDDRCWRKYGMKYIVFYEILIAQTNETIAQFQNKWAKAPEYGPMIPMDGGRCTPLSTKDDKDILPVECYQFNGELEQPNVGPFVGAGIKDDDVRAPYPDTYWFSFPNTCPTTPWKSKTYDSECRKTTRGGLCPIDKAPDGVQCTYAYDILGWVPIDDLVGITMVVNNKTNSFFNNFTEWCSADEGNIEFAAKSNGEFEAGLQFWKDPLSREANKDRADSLLALYSDIVDGNFVSRQIDARDKDLFRALPAPEALEAINPKCYKSVGTCNEGNGCKRMGYSQICQPCTSAKCPTDASFKFPTLAKAPTSLSEEQTTSGALLDQLSPVGGNRTSAPTGKNAASGAHVALASMVTAMMAMLVL